MEPFIRVLCCRVIDKHQTQKKGLAGRLLASLHLALLGSPAPQKAELWRWREEVHKLKVILYYVESLRPAWDT